MSITERYAGVVVNQNHTATGQYGWRAAGAGWIYQTFTLPSDYQRGKDNEQRTPDLGGIQVLVTIDNGYASTASLDFVLQYYGGSGTGWVTLNTGTVIGAHTDRLCWFDIWFYQPIAIAPPTQDKLFRFGIQGRTATGGVVNQPVTVSDTNTYIIGNQSYTTTLESNVPTPILVNNIPAFLMLNEGQVTYSIQQGTNTLSYVSPTPLGQLSVGRGQAYRTDTVTPLLGTGTTSSLNFRVLALTADNGTNFLNNEYRGVVITNNLQGPTPTSTSQDSGYWMSPPQPSRFAVQSLYFDVRPAPTTLAYGIVNMIGNPSFEFDAVGGSPLWWSAFTNGGTVTDQTVHSTQVPSNNSNFSPWVYDGSQTLHMQYTFTATNQQRGIISPYQVITPTTGGMPTNITVSLTYDLIGASSSSLIFSLLCYDSTQTLLPGPYGTESLSASIIGTSTLSGTLQVPANAAYVRYLVSALSTGPSTFEAYVDGIQATLTAVPQSYFDGDDPNSQWTGQAGQSASVQLLSTLPANDNLAVVDGVLVDPLTPNMAFSVYYSIDDAYTSTNMIETDWEQKLWTRVPEVYPCAQRQAYAFPEPVRAKYLKVEFTNLQAQPYHLKGLSKRITYKKFPTWVANFFVAQLQLPSFVASQVNVQYDALSFAYDYFLDDLNQTPDQPSAPPQDLITQLTSYFDTTPTPAGLDPTTLAQINLTMKPFQAPLGTYANTDSSLGSFVTGLLASTTPPISVSEGGTLVPIDYSAVSTLQREAVVFEQSLPVMYFFVTCRHTYKELIAPFEYNRAYFAGVKEISFLRNDYQIATDTDLYIESGGDTTNMAFTDWVIDTDNAWHVY